MDDTGQEYSAERLIDVVSRGRDLPPARLVDAIFASVAEWRGDTPPNDDMTAVAVRITT
jgi:serine phosphatase RsbU (regulator of sigma subunit)